MALWTPAEITTALWLDASDSSTITLNGSTVSQWADKSGNNRHASQPTATKQPTLTAAGLGDLDALTFDGTSGSMVLSFSVSASDYYILAALQPAVTTKTGGMYLLDVQTGRLVFAPIQSVGSTVGVYANTTWSGSTAGTTASQLLGWQLDYVAGSNGSKIYRNGSVLNSLSYTARMAIGDAIRIGSVYDDGASFFSGLIGEVIMISAAVTTADRQLLEGYLAWKWGLESSLPADHPYKSAAPTLHKVSGTVTVN